MALPELPFSIDIHTERLEKQALKLFPLSPRELFHLQKILALETKINTNGAYGLISKRDLRALDKAKTYAEMDYPNLRKVLNYIEDCRTEISHCDG